MFRLWSSKSSACCRFVAKCLAVYLLMVWPIGPDNVVCGIQADQQYKLDLLQQAAAMADESEYGGDYQMQVEQLVCSAATIGATEQLDRFLNDSVAQERGPILARAVEILAVHGHIDACDKYLSDLEPSGRKIMLLAELADIAGQVGGDFGRLFELALQHAEMPEFSFVIEDQLNERKTTVLYDATVKSRLIDELNFCHYYARLRSTKDAGEREAIVQPEIGDKQLKELTRLARLRYRPDSESMTRLSDFATKELSFAFETIRMNWLRDNADPTTIARELDNCQNPFLIIGTATDLLRRPAVRDWPSQKKRRLGEKIWNVYTKTDWNHWFDEVQADTELHRRVLTQACRINVTDTVWVDYEILDAIQVVDALIESGFTQNGDELLAQVKVIELRADFAEALMALHLSNARWEMAERMFRITAQLENELYEDGGEEHAKVFEIEPQELDRFRCKVIGYAGQKEEFDVCQKMLRLIEDETIKRESRIQLASWYRASGDHEQAANLMKPVQKDLEIQFATEPASRKEVWLAEQAMFLGWTIGRNAKVLPNENWFKEKMLACENKPKLVACIRRNLGSFTPPFPATKKLLQQVLDELVTADGELSKIQMKPVSTIRNFNLLIEKLDRQRQSNTPNVDKEIEFVVNAGTVVRNLRELPNGIWRNSVCSDLAHYLALDGKQDHLEITLDMITDKQLRFRTLCDCAECFPPTSIDKTLDHFAPIRGRRSRSRRLPGGVF